MYLIKFLRLFLVLMVGVFFLVGSGGGGGSSAEPETSIMLKGVVLNNSMNGATVKILSLDNSELKKVTTDSNGSYSLEFNSSKIAKGFIVETTGGTINGKNFDGTLRAFYSKDDELKKANVTLLTTLVVKMLTDKNSMDDFSIDKRNGVVNKLTDVGMVKKSDWFKLNPSFVNAEHLSDLVKEIGVDAWLTGISDDLNDLQLERVYMKGFPKANGGVVSVEIGDNHKITTFEGATNVKKLKIIPYKESNSSNYSYKLDNALDGMTLSSDGEFKYEVPVGVDIGEKAVEITVTNKDTLTSRKISLTIVTLDSEVVVSGIVGADGGRLTNNWEDTILTIPVGAVDGDSEFKVLRSLNSDGSAIYRTVSSLLLKKVLNLKTPAHINTHRKSGEDENLEKLNFNHTQKREGKDGWRKWKTWYADYVQLQTPDIAIDPINRLKTIRNGEPQAVGVDVHLHKEAAKLHSLCGSEVEFDSTCKDKTPVLFVHGFATGLSTPFSKTGSGFGGGSGTWGQLPELISQEGYAVFEFTWKTNARFKDVADNLADAIRKIQNKSGKKVHIIAHSFGGLLSRTYIQNLAPNEPYANNVQSLLTLSTPHSGIFDEPGTYHGVEFQKGQDSISFEGCMQSSCHQAGEATIKIWRYLTLDLSEYLGINKHKGELPALLAKDVIRNGFPVNTRVLMGLTIDRGLNGSLVGTSASLMRTRMDGGYMNIGVLSRNVEDYSISPEDYSNSPRDSYEQGDQLISYAGQRFIPSLANTVTSDLPVYQSGSIEISEKILGAPHGALPNGKVLVEYAFQDDGTRMDFEGYRHSNNNLGQGAGGVTLKGDVGIAYVQNSKNLPDTDKPHEALTEIKSWLSSQSSDEAQGKKITLKFHVVDAESGDSLSDAGINVAINGVNMEYKKTGSDGRVSIELPFKKNSKYSVAVVINGYHTEEFDLGYRTGESIETSSIEYPRIELQSDVFGRGSLSGTVIDSVTGYIIDDVKVSIERNGIVREVQTDVSGEYNFNDLVRGVYTLTIVKNGYYDSTFKFTVKPDINNIGSMNMRKKLSNEKMSIRLTWGLNPRDLDSHLLKYDSSYNELYHLYFGDKNDLTSGDNLDLDDITSYGPETTTIQAVDSSSSYAFWVYQYAGSGSISSTSNAKVEVNYGGHSTIPIQSAPTSGTGRWWKVFDIINGEVIPCQTGCIRGDSLGKPQRKPTINSIPSISLPPKE